MEQGIKMLEELGYVKSNISGKNLIRFEKEVNFNGLDEIDTMILSIEKLVFQKWLYESEICDYITLEEAKACIMIMGRVS